ncbi:MAG: hypothetical protein HQL12_03800 [Candidatus Omnitrophica bacterium]|nr:hypothetical protein [Candidatus Omnitrophota bacterium]
MKKLFKIRAVTLIEIIIVFMIIGILTAIALPIMFTSVVRSESAEAVLNIKNFKDLVELCGVKNNYDFTQCSSIVSSSNNSSAHFTYQLTLGSQHQFILTAVLSPSDNNANSSPQCFGGGVGIGAGSSSSSISLCRGWIIDPSKPTFVITGEGVFNGVL